MKNVHAQQVRRIDALMEHASRDLVATKYFEAETACVQALDRAYAIRDFERMARILMPLEESRRQKRDLAFDAGVVHVVAGQIPAPGKITPGLYLVCPPRVGIDGRELRERADRKKVPAIVVVREPTSRDGMWPVVSIGPVTVRTKVAPPAAPVVGKSGKTRKGHSAAPSAEDAGSTETVPPPTWFLHANEAIGDAALHQMAEESRAGTRVDMLMARLAAHPDHEKLHQALAVACREALREPVVPTPVPAVYEAGVDDEEEATATSSYRGRGVRSGRR